MLSWLSPREPAFLFHYQAFCMIVNVLRYYLQISCSLHATVMTPCVMILLACPYLTQLFLFSVRFNSSIVRG